MASLIEAIDIKRKMFFEYEGAPYHVLDVEVSRPTARGGQTLVRIKMRNLVTRAVFDKTFKAGEKFEEPDLVMVDAAYLYADSGGLNFMDQETFDTLTLRPELLGDDRLLLVDNLIVQVQKFNGNPIGVQFPPHVEMAVRETEEGVRGNTASGSVTKTAALESGSRFRCPCSSSRAKKSGCTPKPGSLPEGRDMMTDLKNDLAALRLEREPDSRASRRWIGWLVLAVCRRWTAGAGAWWWLSRERPIEVEIATVSSRQAGRRPRC